MLFIGGSQDGKWMDVREGEWTVRFAVLSEVRGLEPIRATESIRTSYDVYHRMEFRVEDKSYFIFKLETLSNQEAFEMLLAGYKFGMEV